jgi:hypothetical protein
LGDKVAEGGTFEKLRAFVEARAIANRVYEVT